MTIRLVLDTSSCKAAVTNPLLCGHPHGGWGEGVNRHTVAMGPGSINRRPRPLCVNSLTSSRELDFPLDSVRCHCGDDLPLSNREPVETPGSGTRRDAM